MRYHLEFSFQRDIWNWFWLDWFMSLLPSYAIVLPVLLTALGLNYATRISLWATVPAISVLVAVGLVTLFYSASWVPRLVVIALFFSFPAAGALSLCKRI